MLPVNITSKRKTKIMATAGPAVNTLEKIQSLIDLGVNTFRINMSHGEETEIRNWFKLLSQGKSNNGDRPAILADLAGPKIRVKEVNSGLVLKEGQRIRISSEFPADENTIRISGGVEFGPVREGAMILIDDGKVQLKVINPVSSTTLECETLYPGPVLDRKGLNFPGIELNLSTLTAKDLRDLDVAIEEKADWIALSFTRAASDYDMVKEYLDKKGVSIPIMAKIERWEALQNIDSIIEKFDAIMVARGDLGGEIPAEQVPLVQKQITKKAGNLGKPVVIATQLLESMITKPVPTRAEVSDIANAVLDGADALLLTGETAMGEHPEKAVNVLNKVILETEASFDLGELGQKDKKGIQVADAIGHATCWIAEDLNVPFIVTMTHSGSTAQKISRYRPKSRILALTPYKETCRKLSLVWGVTPLIVRKYENSDQIPARASEVLLEKNLLKLGDKFVVTGGVPVGKPGTTNYLSVIKVFSEN